jgi:3-oxoadipate enol-lactonase
MLLDMDIDPELGRIACPTLAIGCTHDPLRTPEMVETLAKLIPGARYMEAESGHFMHVQSPELFTGLIVPFLRGG